MGIEKFNQDPLQQKFTKKLEDGGVEFSNLKKEGGNNFLSAQEWFERYYTGQDDNEIPKKLIQETSSEELKALKDKHRPQKTRL